MPREYAKNVEGVVSIIRKSKWMYNRVELDNKHRQNNAEYDHNWTWQYLVSTEDQQRLKNKDDRYHCENCQCTLKNEGIRVWYREERDVWPNVQHLRQM